MAEGIEQFRGYFSFPFVTQFIIPHPDTLYLPGVCRLSLSLLFASRGCYCFYGALPVETFQLLRGNDLKVSRW